MTNGTKKVNRSFQIMTNGTMKVNIFTDNDEWDHEG